MRAAHRLVTPPWTSRRKLRVQSVGRLITTVASGAESALSAKSVIFSGIQPTGIPHLGNYLGALRSWKQLQERASASAKLIFCVVDLHALTTQPNPTKLRQWRNETLAALLAIGLNPERSTLFFQSEVAAHSELMWALSTDASMGYLSRMTQWKSKLALSDSASIDEAEVKTKLRLGLFSYPVLQAADVLVHGATHVPVGHDQKQHLEFARNCAQSFNYTYGAGLIVPEVLISDARRVMSLTVPTSKMSKSTGTKESRILLTDALETIHAKIMQALTDSESGVTYDLERRPGVSNLLAIIAHLESSTAADVAARYRDTSLKAFKEDAAAIITRELAPIRDRLLRLLDSKQKGYLEEVASVGREQAKASSRPVLKRVYELMGLSW